MARELDYRCKLCRREGIKLYLKGSRCEGPKCALERRNSAPGMHGYQRAKLSDYGVRLREKQKVKRFYGVLERQFRRYFALASRSKENTGEALLSILERRLDNVVHRLGFAPSRRSARQLVAHGHILVNGRKCDIPSLLLKPGDEITPKSRPRTLQLIQLNLQEHKEQVPDFLERTLGDPPSGRMSRLPTREDVDPRLTKDKELREQLIIEFASR
ncbi:MAG: 30S ribosomal protein S4 [Gemmataceae bacterium]|nr:30S ribosomal protein S4 [Gemmataceae bacterium]MDW8266349.1 30S ribosomal protein S4 [Gemmataceae bacterium]